LLYYQTIKQNKSEDIRCILKVPTGFWENYYLWNGQIVGMYSISLFISTNRLPFS
jgi:hypothetical protein